MKRIEHWWVAYLTWQFERAAIAQLWALSDRELEDIGLHRSAIVAAVKGTAPWRQCAEGYENLGYSAARGQGT
jgi:uncharacterized protein YjiS (DUF1127 family)